MKLFFKLAWRNIFRNKKRTIITALAIGIGIAALIYTDAIMLGMQKNMIESLTSTYLGEAQIHGRGYKETQELEKTVNNMKDVIDNLKSEKKVKSFTKRVKSQGTISSPVTMKPVMINGIEPEKEKGITKLDDAVINGQFLDSKSRRDILIGKKMAENLEVSIGDRIVITLSEAETGEISQMMFRISGIFDLATDDIEKGMVFINLDVAQNILNLENRIHEIAIKYTDINFSKEKNSNFLSRYSTNGNEADNWPTLVPQMQMVIDMQSFSLSIVGIIIFGVVVFGIFNTLFMAIYERIFEFGVLKAIGTKSKNLVFLIIFEAASLGFVASVIGIVLGYLLTIYTSSVGIDYSGIELAGAAFTGKLYPVIELRQFVQHPLLIWIFTILISIYPAVHAGKLNIADSLRKSL
ncbi:MAG: ABC transporter permease [Kosmotoga sp.]|nr:MAG: ABC transporter permease [Kosmotoga sp.]